MKYICPLCGQPVSLSLYRKITGIWEERQKLLKEIKKQRTQLTQKLRREREKLRKEATKFKRQRARLIKQAVDRRTKPLESQISALRQKEERMRKRARDEMKALRRKEKQAEREAQNKIKTLERRQKLIERKAHDEVRRATALANARAKRLAEDKFKSFKKGFRASIRSQLKQAHKRGALQEQRRYKRLERSFHTTLSQMRTKDKQLRKQADQIKDLQHQLERRTTPQLEGLLYEDALAKELKKRFPEDRVQHTGKGGDVIQNVMREKQRAGTIVYECKRVKHYSSKHVKQAAEAKRKRGADFAVLVTNAMKRGTQGFFVQRGVIVVHATGVLSLVPILRHQIVQIAGMKLGRKERDKAIKLVLDYLEGPEFTNSMDTIIQESISVCKELMDEVKKHAVVWRKRYAAYKKIYEEATTVKSTSKDLLSKEPKHKIEKEPLPVLVKLPEAEETKQKVPIAVAVPARKKKKPIGIAVVAAGDDNVKEL